ncbi:MAG: hypothetical protein ABWZ88_16735 [Variovorax sp.]
MTPTRRSRTLRAAAWLAAAAVLAGVFAMYAQPAFVVRMIDQIWACF